MTEDELFGGSKGEAAFGEAIKAIFRHLKVTDIEVIDNAAKCNFRGTSVLVTKSELVDYFLFKSLVRERTETSVSADGYLEQAVEVHSNGPAAYRVFRENRDIVLQHEQSGFSAELGPISINFALLLIDTEKMSPDLRRMIYLRSPRARGDSTLSEFFSRFQTLKVIAPSSHALGKNLKQLKLIGEAALFHISYGTGMALIELKSWERSFFRLASNRTESVQFPLQTYNQELVAYYQMAVGAESLILSYLTLYKILEYFYTDASEHALHKKIKDQLLAPDFSHTKVAKLRDLAKIVRSFDNKMNEKGMLQTVLEQRIDKDELKAWIERFEVEFGQHFTENHEIFGKTQRVDLSDNQIFPGISARIYQIRNALVHNKEGEESRFTPFSGQEGILTKEAPLLLRIAEELIQKSGKDIHL